MALLEINWRPSDRELRGFAIAQFIATAIITWLIVRRLGWNTAALTIGAAGLAAMLVGLARPKSILILFVIWTAAGYPIGWVVSHAMLAIVYYGVITPIGVILRWRGRDSLQLKPHPEAKSYWMARSGPPATDRYFRQY